MHTAKELDRFALLVQRRELTSPTYQQPSLQDDVDDIGVAIFNGCIPPEYAQHDQSNN